MSGNILIQNELDENLTYSSRVGEFSSNSLWIKRLALISLLVLQLPLNIQDEFHDGFPAVREILFRLVGNGLHCARNAKCHRYFRTRRKMRWESRCR